MGKKWLCRGYELPMSISLQYIAGFFDGEGFVTIQKASTGSHSHARYWLIVSMSNTHRRIIDEIQKMIGFGRVIFHKGDRGRKPHYRLTFYSRQAFIFLKLKYPYLVVKKREAEIAFKYYEKNHRLPHLRANLTVEQVDFQQECYLAIKNLHGNKIWIREKGSLSNVI